LSLVTKRPKQANARFGKPTPQWTLRWLAQHCEAKTSQEGKVGLGDYVRFPRRQFSTTLASFDHRHNLVGEAIRDGKELPSEVWKPVA
jgi:hypothetical protein